MLVRAAVEHFTSPASLFQVGGEVPPSRRPKERPLAGKPLSRSVVPGKLQGLDPLPVVPDLQPAQLPALRRGDRRLDAACLVPENDQFDGGGVHARSTLDDVRKRRNLLRASRQQKQPNPSDSHADQISADPDNDPGSLP